MDSQMQQGNAVLPFEFTGKAGEYFKIWIVNVLLTILTLGIYSPWAKVRNKRYFYGNTMLDGSSFEYLADPVAILKGRLIAFAVVVAYYLTTGFLPISVPLFLLALVIALPWLVTRALAFNARNSAFRNIRFDFKADYGEAFIVFIGMPLLVLVTLGLAYPYFQYRVNRFVVANSGFGTSGFHFDAGAKSFYGIYLKALGMMIVLIIAFALSNQAVMVPLAHSAETQSGVSTGQAAMLLLPMLLLVPLYMMIGTYVQTATTNLVFNGSQVDRQQFRSSLLTRGMFWIHVSNLFAVMLSLGLLIPWAKIRLARYRIEHLDLETSGDLGGFVAGMQDDVKATGEELADVLDIDLGL